MILHDTFEDASMRWHSESIDGSDRVED